MSNAARENNARTSVWVAQLKFCLIMNSNPDVGTIELGSKNTASITHITHGYYILVFVFENRRVYDVRKTAERIA